MGDKSGLVIETNAEYHNDKTAISKSRLVKMSVCPAYFKWCEDNPQERTDDLILGSAFHKLVLEPETFGVEFVVMPQIDKRTKEGKAAYEAFVNCVNGRDVITTEQYQTICEMRDSIMANKYAVALLKGEHEKSMYGADKLTGELIKTRPDCYRMVKDKLVITDLKSCRSAVTADFMRDCVKYGYDLQAYMYCMNASQVLNIPLENIDFVFIAVEKTDLHLVNILQADTFVLQRGEALFRQYIGEYHYCKQTNNWYGLNGEQGIINTLGLPAYLVKEVENG